MWYKRHFHDFCIGLDPRKSSQTMYCLFLHTLWSSVGSTSPEPRKMGVLLLSGENSGTKVHNRNSIFALCLSLLLSREDTVGAQSIACAQSIAHSQIGDNICKKKNKKKGNSAAHSWTKTHIFSFKIGKQSCFKKVVFIFVKISLADFFWHRRIFADITYIPISRWGYGETIRRKFIRNPQFCSERWSPMHKV
jgi:hypothetical protein